MVKEAKIWDECVNDCKTFLQSQPELPVLRGLEVSPVTDQ